jgi:hypothetical protein
LKEKVILRMSPQEATQFEDLAAATTFHIPLANAMTTALISLALWSVIAWTVSAMIR